MTPAQIQNLHEARSCEVMQEERRLKITDELREVHRGGTSTRLLSWKELGGEVARPKFNQIFSEVITRKCTHTWFEWRASRWCESSPKQTKLTCCTRIFLVYVHCAYNSHTLMRVTHMLGSRVSAVRMSSSLCHLTFSLLMFHPSLLPIGKTVAGPRETEERERLAISVAESMSKKCQRNGISVSLKSHRKSCSEESLRKFYSDGWDLRGHLEWRAQQACSWWKFSLEKIFLEWVRHGDPKFEAKTNSEYAFYLSHSVSLNLKDCSYWKIFHVQIKRSVRMCICVANWRWRTVFIKEAAEEVSKNLKNWKDAVTRNKMK